MKFFNTILLFVVILTFASCEELLQVEDISVEEVMLIAPSDSTVVSQNNVNFTWSEIIDATSYHIQVADPDFLQPSQIVIDTLIVKDSTYLGPNFSKALPNSAYEWRVSARNSDFETGYSTNSFLVNTPGN